MPTFILDVHLGKLTKYLRMLGFDAIYRNDLDDRKIITIAESEKRIVLSRNAQLIKNIHSNNSYKLQSQHPKDQLNEIIHNFNLHQHFKPFTRCMACNGVIHPVEKEIIWKNLPHRTLSCFTEFYQCQNCKKLYWKGSHYDKMAKKIKELELNCKKD